MPDKVFESGSAFRPNLSGPEGEPGFGSEVGIGLGGISCQKSSMSSKGVEAYMGASVGINFSKTMTDTSAYLSDVNGDGITDLVNSGSVRFGRPDDPENPRPVPLYGPNSALTPYPIGTGAVDGENLLEDYEERFQEMIDENPLHDTLRSGQVC